MGLYKNERSVIAMKNQVCPVCKEEGARVSYQPVKKLLRDGSMVEEEVYFLCMNKTCQVSYYNKDLDQVYRLEDLKVDLWYKDAAKEKLVCYCARVSEDQVLDAVINKGAENMGDIISLTGAMKNSNCKENNPLGRCCHRVIEEAIAKGLKLKEDL